jgi:hypothetical protein
MLTIVLKLALEFFKVFWLILKMVKGFKQEEFEIFKERVETVTKILNNSFESNSEVVNEHDFISILEKEQKIRYEKYKAIAKTCLLSATGINEMEKLTAMGFGARVTAFKTHILDILRGNDTIDNKSIKIAKKLLEYK